MSEPLPGEEPPLRRVLLVGATGLVGRQVMALSRRVPAIALAALARREVRPPRGARVEMLLAPVAEWPTAIRAIAPEAVICALGTTRGKAGNDGLTAIDRDLVQQVAEAAHAAGARHFVLVSSVGADPLASVHYLRTKGEAEREVRQLGFERLDVLRPGLLRGVRRGDLRVAEGLARLVSPVTDLVLRGEYARYRSIRAGEVAAASLALAGAGGRGFLVHEHFALRQLAALLAQRGPDSGGTRQGTARALAPAGSGE